MNNLMSSQLVEIIALLAIILWPLIPLFWIPVHGLPQIKRLGRIAYLLLLVTWLPEAVLLYLYREPLLSIRVDFPLVVTAMGFLLLMAGIVLHTWTGLLLGLGGLMGLPELSGRAEGKLVRSGPFTVVRHPTYLSHSLMLSGVFLLSGVVAVGIITILDLTIVNLMVIPLEERELEERFGADYKKYKKTVGARFFPW